MKPASYVVTLLTLLALASQAKVAEEPLYDEKADAPKQVATAIAAACQAGKAGKNIVLIFGANW
jgi:hypothetical protein